MENILLTSWNWIYLSDFGVFQPTQIPQDDPTEFSLYFDASARRACYLAPERFISVSSTASSSDVMLF